MTQAARRILVVDDEEAELFVLQETLVGLGSGCEIVTASNGHDALSKAAQLPFDLLDTDLKMPDMDGMELTRMIRALNPETTVIWMPAYGCDAVAREVVQLGVNRCVDKPLEVDEIRQIVRQALGLVRDGAQG